MAIKENLSDLPLPEREDGFPPDPHVRFGHLLANAWHEEHEARREAEHVSSGALLRASMAGMCSRLIGYHSTKTPESNPPDLSDQWRMGLGTMVHEAIEPAVKQVYGDDAILEPMVDYRDTPLGLSLAGRGDVFLKLTTPTEDNTTHTIAIEIKTAGGFKFKKQIGARGPAEGPNMSAIMQGALCAKLLDADELVIIVLALELLSDREVQKLPQYKQIANLAKFVAEWTFTREQYEAIAERELKRQARILEVIQKGELPPRHNPDLHPKARIVDPRKGRWELVHEGLIIDSGEHWGCNYCRQQDRCVEAARAEGLIE